MNPEGESMNKNLATKPSLVRRFGDRYGVDASKVMDTLKATAFAQSNGAAPDNHQMMALLIVADQYKLNPFTREIYAFPDKNRGIVPIVGLDGWVRILNEHPQVDGWTFAESEEWHEAGELDGNKRCPVWMEVIIHRKDRSHAVVVREYLDEVYRPPFRKNGNVYEGPWQTHTKRFLRHKTLIQGARIACGFTGIYDEDEGNRIIDAEFSVSEREPAPGATTMNARPRREPWQTLASV